MNYLCNKNEVVPYIVSKYESKYNDKISSIKLQKALYFIFAEVSSKTSLITEENENVAYLFDANFEAYPYGPIDKDVYMDFKTNNIPTSENLQLDINEGIIQYIDELLAEIFELSDFRLIDISHEDKEWKIKIKSSQKKMSSQAIVDGYKKC